jgi:hypothetical protein
MNRAIRTVADWRATFSDMLPLFPNPLAQTIARLASRTSEQIGPLLNRYARVIAGLDDERTMWRDLRAKNQWE